MGSHRAYFSTEFYRFAHGSPFDDFAGTQWSAVPFLKLPWIKGFWIGGAGFGCGSLLLLIALSMTDAMTAALAAAAMPVFAVGLEVLLDSRRLSFRFLVAVALVLLGGALASGVMPGRLSKDVCVMAFLGFTI
jgi:drug/metabolite transporter (DMT)-like permease